MTGLVADCTALLALEDDLKGDGGTLNWDVGLRMDDNDDVLDDNWRGITIEGTPPRVTKLQVYYHNLEGPLPAAVGELTELTYMVFDGNPLTGSIPKEVGKLTKLTYMSFLDNNLSGSLPKEIGDMESLTTLIIATGFTNPARRNRLSGNIPKEVGKLTNLERLSLEGNQLEGEIPPSLGELPLQHLHLHRNPNLTGSLPDWWGRTNVDHDKNEDTPNINSMNDLQQFYLWDTQWEDPLPPAVASQFSSNQGHLRTNRRPEASISDKTLRGNQLSFNFPLPAFRDPDDPDGTTSLSYRAHSRADLADPWGPLPEGWTFTAPTAENPGLTLAGSLNKGQIVHIRLTATDQTNPPAAPAPFNCDPDKDRNGASGLCGYAYFSINHEPPVTEDPEVPEDPEDSDPPGNGNGNGGGGGGGGGGGSGDDEDDPAPPMGRSENPPSGSESQPQALPSGIGLLSGWVCEAAEVEFEIATAQGETERHGAAYGTERLDTEAVCGDTDNGFGLLFNWNRLGDGEHTVTAFVDGVELGRATALVTTLGGEEFLTGAAGECMVEDFPTDGQTVTLVWQENSQNFVITGVE